MAAPSLSTEVSGAGNYPSNRFNQRERKLLESVKTYVDSLSSDTIITTEGDIIIGDAGGDAARLALGSAGLPLVAGASTVSYAELDGDGIADAAVSLEHLDSGIAPSHIVVYAGSFTTAGGDAAEVISVSGVLATDIAIVQLHTEGSSPVTVDAAAAATDAINVTMSGDPSTDHVLRYMVLRAAA